MSFAYEGVLVFLHFLGHPHGHFEGRLPQHREFGFPVQLIVADEPRGVEGLSEEFILELQLVELCVRDITTGGRGVSDREGDNRFI
jgi:hypothetical protein